MFACAKSTYVDNLPYYLDMVNYSLIFTVAVGDKSKLHMIPDTFWAEVFSYLPAEDLKNAEISCTKWFQIVTLYEVWMLKCLELG